MSLVGTRPPTVDEWEQYELHHRSRMDNRMYSEHALVHRLGQVT